MTTRVDAEQIETSKSEKLLATVLTIFLLIGLLWVYFHIDVDRDDAAFFAQPRATAPDRAALQRNERALQTLRSAKAREALARRRLVDRREAYRTALDAGRSDRAFTECTDTASVAQFAAAHRRRGDRTPNSRRQPVAGRQISMTAHKKARKTLAAPFHLHGWPGVHFGLAAGGGPACGGGGGGPACGVGITGGGVGG